MRIIYLCPASNAPSGGARTIYRHSEALNVMGCESAVVHPVAGFRCSWFRNNARVINREDVCADDYLVLPEHDAAEIAKGIGLTGFRYAVFVQNANLMLYKPVGLTDENIQQAYRHADAILSISADTAEMISRNFPFATDKILSARLSVDGAMFFHGDTKEKLISYMPRKLADHADKVSAALEQGLRGRWRLQAIDGLTDREAAAILRRSRIFLSFSHVEGLGLPPIEAAMCGNFVIGYHGDGGKEYWAAPNFEEIAHGDIASFIARVSARAEGIDSGKSGIETLLPGMNRLAKTYSSEYERADLAGFWRRASSA